MGRSTCLVEGGLRLNCSAGRFAASGRGVHRPRAFFGRIAVICKQRKAFGTDGTLVEEQFRNVPFWFEADVGASAAAQLKAILWEVFQTPGPPVGGPSGGRPPPSPAPATKVRLQSQTLLLFLCSDMQVVRGVQKAFAAMAGPDGRLSRAALFELLHFHAATSFWADIYS